MTAPEAGRPAAVQEISSIARTDLRRDGTSPHRARLWASTALARWGIAGALADDVLLIVSELVTNAFQHARGRGLHAAVALADDGSLQVAVRDQGPASQPQPHGAASDEHGRGLLITRTLSTTCGHITSQGGRAAWANLTPAPAPASTAPGPTHDTPDPRPLRVVVLICTQPGRGAEQIAAHAALAPVVRAEPGCLRYDLESVEGNPDAFVVIGHWTTAKALQEHHTSPHMVAARAASTAFRAGPAEMLILGAAPVA